MIYFFSPEISSRIEYAADLVFNEVMGTEYQIVNNPDVFALYSGIRLNYSQNEIPGAIQIIPSGLLTETGVRQWDFDAGMWEELPVIFANSSNSLPFDIFSAVFYLVTRYEEYLSFTPDQYGRFEAERSVSNTYEFLRLPIIDLWCKKLASILMPEEQFPGLSEGNYSFQLTIDIDQPWLYKNKGIFYAIGSLLRELMRLDFIRFADRLKVLFGSEPDPGDVYEFLTETQKVLKLPIKYFFLCRKSGKHDVNRSVRRKVFHKLVKLMDDDECVGIHPSLLSNSSEYILNEEINLLTSVLKRKIVQSRQHFLLLRFPDTYRNLIKKRISEDYSMGYSSKTGFRAGIARAFNFFDLDANQVTGLRVVPFQIMDRTLLNYKRISPDEAITEYEYYAKAVRNVGGQFVCLWHNDSLGDRGEWKGWKKVFEKMIVISQ